MSLIKVENSIFRFSEDAIAVNWASYDFEEDVAKIPDIDEEVRSTLIETGVMYVPDAVPRIRVSHLLPYDMQSLSALHEELCMNQKIAPCTAVEELVINSILDSKLRRDFVKMRIRMFGALCMINTQFNVTLTMLEKEATTQ